MGVLQEELNRVIADLYAGESAKLELLRNILKKQRISTTDSELLTIVHAMESSDENGALKVTIDGVMDEIAITSEDIDSALVEHEQSLDGTTERLINRALEEMVPSVLQSLYTALPQALKERRSIQRNFEKRLKNQWQGGLDRLEMLIIMAHESGESYVEDMQLEFADQEPSEDSCLLDVLIALHCRACRTAREVLCLLKAGYADGANARWRSLHEIAVTAQFVAEKRGEVPKRFLDHAAVESWRSAQQYQKHCEALSYESFSDGEMAEMKEAADAMIAKYGDTFKDDYGWAANAISNSRPTFAQIEATVDLSKWRPHFRQASQSVHAGPHGMLQSLGIPDEVEPMFLAGPSNAGLFEPGHQTAISLTIASVALLTSFPNLDSLVSCKSMQTLCDDIGNELMRTHDDLIDRIAKKFDE